MISRSSSLASSTPATSWKVTLFCFSEMSRARALPNDSAFAPPPCIWRMKKIQTPMKRSIGTHWEDRVPRVRVGRFHGDPNTPVLQRLDEVGVLDDVGPEHLRRILERVRDVVAADHDRLHAALVHRPEELGEVGLLLPALLRALEDGEQEDDDEPDHHPEREVLVHLIHPRPL